MVFLTTSHSSSTYYHQRDLAGHRHQGKMSTVRRLFCLFVTFDLLFTSLMWLVRVMMRGETLEQIMNTDILQYSVKISLFDIVMVTVCRCVVLLLFYAVLYINNWSVITVQPTAQASSAEGLPAHNSSQPRHTHKMATEVSAPSMPQLQSVQKAMALPTVGAAVGQVGAFYTKVKGAHSLLEWALSTAEAGVYLAANTAAPYVAAPLVAGDAKVAAALDELERRVPLVTEPPKVIVETTRQAVMTRISPHVNKVFTARAAAEQRVSSLKELSWAKANALLSTAYGQKAVNSVDTGATYAMQLLDHYLPAVGVQEEPTQEIVAVANDPAMHTVQTVGRLSAVAARRVWANLAYRVNELRKSGVELDVRRYLTALLAALHLANVTSQQQQREMEEQEKEKPQAAEPAPLAPESPNNTQDSAPTTANQVKATPESKSTETSNN